MKPKKQAFQVSKDEMEHVAQLVDEHMQEVVDGMFVLNNYYKNLYEKLEKTEGPYIASAVLGKLLSASFSGMLHSCFGDKALHMAVDIAKSTSEMHLAELAGVAPWKHDQEEEP